jgi:hypothetical protein
MVMELSSLKTSLKKLMRTDDPIPEVPLVIHRVVDDEPEKRARSSIDLTGKDKLVMVLGAGSSGKTTLMRWMIERAFDAGHELAIATTDVGRATLRRFFSESDGPMAENDVSLWLESLFTFLVNHPQTAAVDFRADMTLVPILKNVPKMHSILESAGVHPVVFYMLTPRVEDLTVLRQMEDVGFQPATVALVMNCAMAKDPANAQTEFRAIRHQSIFKETVARGAVQLWMPNLGPAREIENAGMSFMAAASDGSNPFRASKSFNWWRDMEAGFDPVMTWLP